MSKYLYHYTSLEHLKEIKKAGYIKKTPSNLLAPKNLRIVDHAWVDPATDNYYPVVWLTDSESPERLGIECDHPTLRDAKKRIRISIPKKSYYFKWNKWAQEHNMDREWRKKFTRGFNWQSWYVSEVEIPLESFSEIYDRQTGNVIHLA